MAILYTATITPTKQEIIEAWLDRQAWGGHGPVVLVGAYRFDDPEGEVGVEGHLVQRGDAVLHVPLTYRSAPVPELEPHLAGTMQHSTLGPRWVYDATADPVARACFERALAGQQQQAVLERWDGDRYLGVQEPTARLEVSGGQPQGPPTVVDTLGDEPDAACLLVASWAGGSGVVAYSPPAER